MKQIIAIFLTVLIFAVSAKDFTAYFVFKLNQNYIAKTLCVNKDKKASTCHGKCFLNKKIKESKQQEDKYPASKLENKQFNLYVVSIPPVPVLIEKENSKHFPFYKEMHSSLYTSELLRPPRLPYS